MFQTGLLLVNTIAKIPRTVSCNIFDRVSCIVLHCIIFTVWGMLSVDFSVARRFGQVLTACFHSQHEQNAVFNQQRCDTPEKCHWNWIRATLFFCFFNSKNLTSCCSLALRECRYNQLFTQNTSGTFWQRFIQITMNNWAEIDPDDEHLLYIN